MSGGVRHATALLILLAATSARGQEELELWLERRLSEPLDLRQAEVDELARLPWLDVLTAEAIVGLREAGGLEDWDSLRRVPGLDAATLAAIEPFVELPALQRRLQWKLRARAAGEPNAAHDAELGLQARRDFLHGSLRADAATARATLAYGGAHWELALGHLRAEFGQQLLTPSTRAGSRTEPLARPRRPRLAPSFTFAQPTALTVGIVHREHGLALLSEEGAVLGLQGGRERGWRLGGRLRAHASLLILGLGSDSVDLEWAIGPAKATILALRSRRDLLGGEFGIDLSHASQAIAETLDPLTGRRLDRARRGIVVHQSWRTFGLSQRWQWRHLRSGGTSEATESDLRCGVSGRWDGRSLDLRVRLAREQGSPLEAATSLRLSQTLLRGVRQSLELRYEPRRDGDRRLVAWCWNGGAMYAWQIALSHSDGSRSSFDARGLPGGGSLLRWLPAGASGLTLATARSGVGIWLDFVRSDAEIPVQWRAGAQFSGRFGRN